MGKESDALKERAEKIGLNYSEIWNQAYASLGIAKKNFRQYTKEQQESLWNYVKGAVTAKEQGKEPPVIQPPEPKPTPPTPTPSAEPQPVQESSPLDTDAQDNIDAVEKGEEFLPDKIEEKLMPSSVASQWTPARFHQAMAVCTEVKKTVFQRLKELPPSAWVVYGNCICLCGKGYDDLLIVPIPILFTDKESEQGKTPDGYTEFVYYANVTNRITGTTIPIVSSCNVGEPLWSMRNGARLSAEEVNSNSKVVRDCRQAAHRGLIKEAYKMMLGLRGLRIEDAEKMGIPVKKWIEAKLITVARK